MWIKGIGALGQRIERVENAESDAGPHEWDADFVKRKKQMEESEC